MSFRRAKSDVHASRKWIEFVNRNEALVEQAQLSLTIVQDERHWLYFLDHGSLYPENDFFIIGILDDSQMAALVELAARYFESFECVYFDPVAFWHERYWETLRNRLGRSLLNEQ